LFIIGYLLEGLAKILDLVLNFFLIVIAARVVLSWVKVDPYNSIVRFIHNVTEPPLAWIRSRIPTVFETVDFSPIIFLLGVIFLQTALIKILYRFAALLGG